MSWKQFPLYGPAVYRYGPFNLRPLIPPVRGDTGTHTLSVLCAFLCGDEGSERSLGQLQRLTPSVQEVLAYIADWIEQKKRSVATLERILSRNWGEPTSGEGAENGQDEPEYDEAALPFYREQLGWLRPLTADVKAQYERMLDLVARGEPIPNTSSNLVAEVIDPRTLAPAPFDAISTKHILEAPAFGQMRQVTSAEPVLGDEIAQYGRFHIVRHLGYRIVGRPYLFSDREPGLWLMTQERSGQALSLRFDTTDGRQVVLFEGWSGDDFSLSALLACVDDWLEQQERGQEIRRQANEKFEAHGAPKEQIRQVSAEDHRDILYHEVALAREEVVGDC